MITFNQLGMTYGQKLLFCDVNLTLNTGKAYALVGANGSGKSTFFKLITGEEEPTLGEILIPKDATIGWLKQDQFRYEETPIRSIVYQGKPKLWKALEEREAIYSSEDWSTEAGYRLSELEEVIQHEDGYAADGQIETILVGLGIPMSYHDRPLSALSGGYKLRVLLAQTLFQNPSILLLDEPTNHLDIESIQWLEKFLKSSYKGLVLFISHDIDFINHLAENIYDIDYGEVRKYSGSYTKFLAEKALIQEQKQLEIKSAQERIAHLQKFVDKFKAKASKAAQARSRVKMIEKIEIPDVVHSSRIAPHIQFQAQKPSAKQVCKIEGLSKAFGDNCLFRQLRLEIKRGDKIAIMGANGKGKSTLLKILQNIIPADEGHITWGTEVKISYFSQDHHELLNESMTVWQWLNDSVAHRTEQQLRKALGQMLFTKEAVDKNILSLSGGEAARLLLTKVMLESPNVLILDEPTNHMDIETIDALADALIHYTGTVIAVSHNRHFIEKIATRVFYFTEGQKVRDYRHGYQEWLEDSMRSLPK